MTTKFSSSIRWIALIYFGVLGLVQILAYLSAVTHSGSSLPEMSTLQYMAMPIPLVLRVGSGIVIFRSSRWSYLWSGLMLVSIFISAYCFPIWLGLIDRDMQTLDTTISSQPILVYVDWSLATFMFLYTLAKAITRLSDHRYQIAK